MEAPQILDLIPDELAVLTRRFDDELANVVSLSAKVGAAAHDATPISYTSLLIALLWADDPTSRWFQAFAWEHEVPIEQIFRHYGIKPGESEKIRREALTGRGFDPQTKYDEFASRSAITMLRNAESMADEVEAGQIGVRHLVASYAFRNPVFHQQDLKDWALDSDLLRHDFVLFMSKQYASETKDPRSIIPDHLPGQFATLERFRSPPILSGYPFTADTLEKLRTIEAQAVQNKPKLMTSELLLSVLMQAGSGVAGEIRDEDDFQQALLEASASTASLEKMRSRIAAGATPLSLRSFKEEAPKAIISGGLRRILEQARTFAFATTRDGYVASRHLIAAMILAERGSTAHELLSKVGVSFAPLRRGMVRRITRRWLSDDGPAWRMVLIGSTPPTLVGYDSDDPARGDDRLDVTRYATAFATVMAAQAVQPPLSIGVFGDWGSGKSFFMRLMSQETEKVCNLNDLDGDGQRLFARRVVPIEFNAWHYAEANLWASLVQTLLEKLSECIHPAEHERDPLAQLELAKEARREAVQELQRTKKIAAAASERVKDAEQTAIQRKKEREELASRDVWNAVADELLGDQAKVEDALEDAERYLGVEGLRKAGSTVGELKSVADQIANEAQAMRREWQWLLKRHLLKPVLAMGAVALLAGGVVLAAWHALAGIESWVTAILVEFSALVALGTLRARTLLAGVQRGLGRWASIRSRIEARHAERQLLFSAELEAARREAERAEAQRDAVRQTKEAAQAAVAEAEQTVKESTSTRRIARLVQGRLEGEDYEQYLGIISTIRHDFGYLSRELGRRPAERGAELEDSDYRPIDRIVLYIDDLDRCPSKQVVSVLEAVHLLLAFPLFVVVVGVDIRWAGTSLHEHYPRHLDAGLQADDRRALPEQGASALDYLEKIFQIPFWLPPMEEDDARNMIAALLPLSEGKERPAEQPAEGTQRPPQRPLQIQPEDKHSKAGKYPSAGARPAEPTVPAAMEIVAAEREYLLRLSGAVGKSPRRLKRFVNTYRIVKASCDALERETFVRDGGKSGSYRAAATLLAIATGAPLSADAVLRQINAVKAGKTLKDLEEATIAAEGICAEPERAYVQEAFRVYSEARKSAEGDVEALRYWATRAARFSFRSGRI